MKLKRAVLRLAILLLVAIAFVELTAIYGRSAQVRVPGPMTQVDRLHHRPRPDIGHFLEFFGAGIEVLLFAVIGRLFLRLRLSARPPNEGQLVSLALRDRR